VEDENTYVKSSSARTFFKASIISLLFDPHDLTFIDLVWFQKEILVLPTLVPEVGNLLYIIDRSMFFVGTIPRAKRNGEAIPDF
jgi:hypothetical protein